MPANKKVLSMLSLCQRAGKLSSGELTCEKALKNSSAYLVIIASDASKNTKEKFNKKSFFYNIPIVEFGTREELGNAIGKGIRAVLAVCDKNFAFKIKSDLNI